MVKGGGYMESANFLLSVLAGYVLFQVASFLLEWRRSSRPSQGTLNDTLWDELLNFLTIPRRKHSKRK